MFISALRADAGVMFDHAVCAVVVVTCFFYLLGFFSVYATSFEGIPLTVWEMFHGFSNVRFFGQFQTMTLPLLTLPFFYARTPLEKTMASVILALWWTLSFASGTRGTWLAITVASVLVFLIGRNAGRWWCRVQAMCALTGLTLYGLFFFAIPAVLGVKGILISRVADFTSLSLRDVLWRRAWEMICERPFLGVGPMHFAINPNGIGAHPHNAVLQIAAEWGGPALLMIGSVICWGLFSFAKHLRQNGKNITSRTVLPVALFASMIGAATQSLVDGVIVMPYSQTFLILICGWSLGWYNENVSHEKLHAVPYGAIAVRVTAILLLAVIAWTSFPEVTQLQQREQDFISRHPGIYSPRFWRQGWIDQ